MSRTSRIDTGSAVLWASAIMLVALVIIQAGKLPENSAHAGQAITEGSYTLMTAKKGRGQDADPEELLYIIDNRNESLLVYEVPDSRKNSMVLVESGSLRNLFLRGSGQ